MLNSVRIFLVLFFLLSLAIPLLIPSVVLAADQGITLGSIATDDKNPQVFHIDGDVYGAASCDCNDPLYVKTFSVSNTGTFTAIDSWSYNVNGCDLTAGVFVNGSSDIWAFAFNDHDATYGKVFTLNISDGGAISQANDNFLDSDRFTTAWHESEDNNLFFIENSSDWYGVSWVDISASQDLRYSTLKITSAGDVQTVTSVASTGKTNTYGAYTEYFGHNQWVTAWNNSTGTAHTGLTSVYINTSGVISIEQNKTILSDATISIGSVSKPAVVSNLTDYPKIGAYTHEIDTGNAQIETFNLVASGTITSVDSYKFITDGKADRLYRFGEVAKPYFLSIISDSALGSYLQLLRIPTDGSVGIGTKVGTAWASGGDIGAGGMPSMIVYGDGSYYSNLWGKYSPGTIYLTQSYVPPILTTDSITGVTSTSAVAGGTITDLGASAPTVRGFCWNTTGFPTVAGSKTAEAGSWGTGSFTGSLSGLSTGTIYYVRSYATNPSGTGYGADYKFFTLVAYNTKVANWDFYAEDITFGSIKIEDQSVNGNDLFCLLGAMNSNLSVVEGAITQSTSYKSSGIGEYEFEDMFGPVSQSDKMYQEGQGENLPVYELVSEASEDMGWGSNQLYAFVMVATAIGFGVGVVIATGSSLLGGAACAILLFAAAGTGVLPLWIFLVYLLAGSLYLWVSRST